MQPSASPQYIGKDLEAMAFANNYYQWVLAEISPYLGNSVAEVGAGVGNFSTLVLETDISSLVAFEPSLEMCDLLQEALGKDKRASAINDFFGKEDSEKSFFDSILYINVLEHIDDDVSELAKAHAALNPEGHLLIFVPALPWLYSEFDREVGHFRRYVKSDLVALVQRAGFSIVTARYFDIAGIIPWYINFVLLRNSMRGGRISLYDRFVVPTMRTLEGLLPVPVGKNVLLVARKE